MDDITFGAVVAALIAAAVSTLGLIVGKEQKVSEFRQKWIDELRTCFVSYIVNINSISDIIRLEKSESRRITEDKIKAYRSLNEASNGIKLRINEKEKPAKKLVSTMKKFESLSENNGDLTPEKISELEREFLRRSSYLLKFEWKRVKRGEPIFFWTKITAITMTAAMAIVLLYVYLPYSLSSEDVPSVSDGCSKISLVVLTSGCSSS